MPQSTAEAAVLLGEIKDLLKVAWPDFAEQFDVATLRILLEENVCYAARDDKQSMCGIIGMTKMPIRGRSTDVITLAASRSSESMAARTIVDNLMIALSDHARPATVSVKYDPAYCVFKESFLAWRLPELRLQTV